MNHDYRKEARLTKFATHNGSLKGHYHSDRSVSYVVFPFRVIFAQRVRARSPQLGTTGASLQTYTQDCSQVHAFVDICQYLMVVVNIKYF